MKTKTIRDLCKTMEEVDWACYIYGTTPEFIREYRARIEAIQEMFCYEAGIDKESAARSPWDTPLTPVAEEKFLALAEWLCGQNRQFTDLYCRLAIEEDNEALKSLAKDPHLL